LGGLRPPSWHPEGDGLSAAGCFVVFPRGRSGPGTDGDPATAAAVIVRYGRAGAPYAPGLLYLREGQVLEEVVRQLPDRPDVLVVNGTGRDHPRHAGMAMQLGYLLDLPTVGVTHRPLRAEGSWPDDERGRISPLTHGEQLVGYWVRTGDGARPLAAHAGWRTSPETAAEVVLSTTCQARTARAGKEPLKR